MIINYINLNNFVENNGICQYCINSWKNIGYDIKEWNENNIPIDYMNVVSEYYANGNYAYCTEILRILLALENDDFLIMDSDVALFRPLVFENYDLYIGDYPMVDNIVVTNNGTLQYNRYKNNKHLQRILDIYNSKCNKLNGTIFNMYFQELGMDIHNNYYNNLADYNIGIIKTNTDKIYHEYVRSWIVKQDLPNYLYINTIPKDGYNYNNYIVYTKWNDILDYNTVSTDLSLVKSNRTYYMPNLKLKEILKIFGIKFDKIIGLNLK